jgi:phage terminase small subunit
MAITLQQQSFVSHYISSGLRNAGRAVVAAGYSNKGARVRAHRLLKRPAIQQAVQVEQERLQQEFELNTNQAVAMLLEAHRKATTASEEIASIREIGKLLGLYAPEKKQTITAEVDLSNLEQLTDAELMKVAGIEA